jgi:thiol-disulfide isomerase/thioredoxin
MFAAMLIVVVGAADVSAADNDEVGLYERWQVFEEQLIDVASYWIAAPRVFDTEEEYRAFLKEIPAQMAARRAPNHAAGKELRSEAQRVPAEARFGDHLAAAVLLFAVDPKESARHADAAERARPGHPQALLVRLRQQLEAKDLDAAEKTTARFAADAKLPHARWATLTLAMGRNQFTRARRWQALRVVSRLLLDAQRAGKLDTAGDCEESVIFVELATQPAGRNGWSEQAVADIEREIQAWEKLPNPFATWILARLFAQQVLVTAQGGKTDEAQAMLEPALVAARAKRSESPDDVDACLRQLALERAHVLLSAPEDRLAARKRFAELLHASVRKFPVQSVGLEFATGMRQHIFGLMREGEYAEAVGAKHALLQTLRDLPVGVATLPEFSFYAFQVAFMPDDEITRGRRRHELLDKPAPPIEATWYHGPPVAGHELRGKVVLLDFWAVWCVPCRAAFPDLIKFHEHYADQGLVVLGVTQHDRFGWDAENARPHKMPNISDADEQTALRQFASHHALPYALGFDTENKLLFNRFGVEGIPQLVLIDRQGIVRLVEVGYGPTSGISIAEKIESLLAK